MLMDWESECQHVSADIVEIKHIMLPPSARDFKDIYVVFELMETDLHQVGVANLSSGGMQGIGQSKLNTVYSMVMVTCKYIPC